MLIGSGILWRRILAGGTAALLAASPVGGAQTNNPPAPRRPNILLILADDLGYGDLGCYGQQRIKTPNLDRLAAEGMRFASFYAGSTVGVPSRAALMLGLDTGHLRLRGNVPHASLQADDVTLAKLLQRGGYRTGLIGKWGLAEAGLPGVPQKQGFDDFLGYYDNLQAHNYYPGYLWRHDSATGFDGQTMLPGNQGDRRGQYVPDLCTTAALSFIKNNKPDWLNRHRPFFLLLSYPTPHANNEEARRTGNGMPVPSSAPYDSESWPQVEKNKAAMITRMDADIGQLMTTLKLLELDEDTVVIFTSDNGPADEGGADPAFFDSTGPFRGIKRSLTEGGIRVPMIVRWPAKVKAGGVCAEPWAFWDVLTTLAEIARLKPPAKLDGISLLPTLLGEPQRDRHGHFYWECHERGFEQAVRTGPWKGIRHGSDGPVELYNLESDPAERTNVAAQHPEVVTKIEKLMQTCRTESPDWPARKAGEGGEKTPAAAAR